MVLLECLRGRASNVDPDTIDSIIMNATKPATEELVEDEEVNLHEAHRFAIACLPRHMADRTEGRAGKRRLRHLGDKNEPGDVKLYNVCFPCQESHKNLAHFGVGVGLYFTALLAYSLVCLSLFLTACDVRQHAFKNFGTDLKGLSSDVDRTQAFVDFQKRISSMNMRRNRTVVIQRSLDGPTMFQFGGGDRPMPIQGVCEILSVLAMIMFASSVVGQKIRWQRI